MEVKNKLNLLEDAEKSLDKLLETQNKNTLSLDLADLDKLTEELSAFRMSLGGKLENARKFHNKLSDLDTQQQRLSGGLDMVRKTQSLQSSLRMLDMAIDERDYDQASLYAQRALSIPHSIINSEFADTVIPSTHHPEPPLQRLDNSLDTLNEIFIKHFNDASANLNQVEISRFFKLFPKINKKLDGITVYSNFVVSLIQRKFKGSLESLSSVRILLDHLANVIEDHQPVVSKYYGEEYMYTVLQTLLKELDEKAGIIFKNWSSGIVDIDTSDFKSTNAIISQITSLSSHWSAFKLFILSNLGTEDKYKQLLHSSRTSALLNQYLNENYISLEMNYFKNSLRKAIEVDETDEDSTPYTSSVLDDAFYVYKIILDRLVGCGNISILKNALGSITDLFETVLIDNLQSEFAKAIKPRTSKMISQQAKTNYNTYNTYNHKSKIVRVSACLNNLDLCSEYNIRILSNLMNERTLQRSYEDVDMAFVRDTLSGLKRMSDTAQSCLANCVDIFFTSTFKSNIKEILKTAINVTNYDKSVDHQSTLFVVIFEREWSQLFDEWATGLTTNNFDEVFVKAVTNLIQLWENIVFNSRFSGSGAIQFEKDVHGLLSLLNGMSTVGIRESFSRIRQISSVLNETSDENSSHYWKLSNSEIQTLQSMKLSNVF
ncbi:COG4-domain-containing protein [Wallemia mellicola]|nr:COG4-domain-containing protein [Wallemia mellicola]